MRYYLVRWMLAWKLWHWLSILKYKVFARIPPLAQAMEKGLAAIERQCLALAREFRPLPCPTGPHPVELHSLLCHAHVEMYLWTVFSFRHFVGVSLPLVVHDDGTLTKEDAQLLGARLPGIRIISRPDADAEMSRQLAGRPRCQEYRKQTPFGPKLFDCNLLHRGQATLHLDSDILFFSDAAKLREIIQQVPARVYYNRESRSPSYNDEALGLSPRFGPCVGDINSGLLFHPRVLVPLDELEDTVGWILDHYRGPLRKDDQLVYSVLAGRLGSEALPSEYAISFSPSDRPWVAMHYHSVSKRYLPYHGISLLLRKRPDFVAAYLT